MGMDTVDNKLIEETEYLLLNYPAKDLKFKVKNWAKKVLKRSYAPNDMIFWPNGLLTRGLRIAGKSDKLLKDYFDLWIAKGMPVKVVDDVIAGETLVYLYHKTGEEKYRKAADKIYEFLKDSRKDEFGSLIYRPSQSNNYVLADMVGMVCPFLCLYGEVFEVHEANKLAETQIINFLRFGMDEKTGLPYHGYEAHHTVSALYADALGIVGWGRAVGWLMEGMGYYLGHSREAMYDSISEDDGLSSATSKDDGLSSATSDTGEKSGYMYVLKEYEKLALKVLDYAQVDGLFGWEIIGGRAHVDTSGSAMIYESMQEVLLGDVPAEDDIKARMKEAVTVGCNALKNKIDNGIVKDTEGESLDFGMYPQKYGCYPWGQGTVLALLSKLS